MEQAQDPKEPQTNVEPDSNYPATPEESIVKEHVEDDYSFVVTTKCVTHDAQDIQDWRQRKQKYQGMGMDDEIEKPPKKSKFYQFHIREVESVVEYEDDDFGTITVINKYNGNQVPILEDFLDVAEIHKEYNKYKDKLLEDSTRHEH